MEKIKNVFYKIIMGLLFIMAVIATVCALCNFYQTESFVLSPLVIILGVITLIFFFIGISKLIDKIDEKYRNLMAVFLAILFFGGLIFFGNHFSIIPSYDLSHVERELMLMMENGPVISNVGYFAKYTNQVPLTILLYYVYKLGSLLNFSNLKFFAIIINSLFMTISAYFTFLSVKELKNSKCGLISLLFFIMNPVFYVYASYYYTDTLCLPFASVAIYLFIISRNSKTIKKIISLIIAGFILAIGFKIRVVVAILLIGIIITLWLNNEKFKEIIKSAGSLVVGFVIGVLCFGVIESNFTIPHDEKLEFPMHHWIMMGLNGESGGRYTGEDHAFTKEKKNKDARKKANLQVIKERIHDLGFIGYGRLLIQKICLNWSNGAYRYIDKLDNVDDFSYGYELVAGNQAIFMLYAMQICKSLVLVIFTYIIFLELTKRQDKNIKFIMISLFGAFLFYLIWEVQARYSLSFLPWMLILFSFGIDHLNESLNNSNKGIKVMKIVSIIVLVLSLNLMVINYNKYTVEKKNYYDTVINQSKNRRLLLKNINDKIVEQTFITDKEYNSISLKFIKDDGVGLSSYSLELYDEDNLLYNSIFTSDDVVNEKFKRFNFDTIKPNGMEEYVIKVNKVEGDRKIGIVSYEYEPYKAYPKGIVRVNGEVTSTSLAFRVQNKVKRSYVSKSFYIIMCVVILIFELFTFYPYVKKHR